MTDMHRGARDYRESESERGGAGDGGESNIPADTRTDRQIPHAPIPPQQQHNQYTGGHAGKLMARGEHTHTHTRAIYCNYRHGYANPPRRTSIQDRSTELMLNASSAQVLKPLIPNLRGFEFRALQKSQQP